MSSFAWCARRCAPSHTPAPLGQLELLEGGGQGGRCQGGPWGVGGAAIRVAHPRRFFAPTLPLWISLLPHLAQSGPRWFSVSFFLCPSHSVSDFPSLLFPESPSPSALCPPPLALLFAAISLILLGPPHLSFPSVGPSLLFLFSPSLLFPPLPAFPPLSPTFPFPPPLVVSRFSFSCSLTLSGQPCAQPVFLW